MSMFIVNGNKWVPVSVSNMKIKPDAAGTAFRQPKQAWVNVNGQFRPFLQDPEAPPASDYLLNSALSRENGSPLTGYFVQHNPHGNGLNWAYMASEPVNSQGFVMNGDNFFYGYYDAPTRRKKITAVRFSVKFDYAYEIEMANKSPIGTILKSDYLRNWPNGLSIRINSMNQFVSTMTSQDWILARPWEKNNPLRYSAHWGSDSDVLANRETITNLSVSETNQTKEFISPWLICDIPFNDSLYFVTYVRGDPNKYMVVRSINLYDVRYA